MPCRSTFMSRIGSTLPPESTTTAGVSNRLGSSITAATPTAPAGSTTSLARSMSMSSAWEIDSSLTVSDVVDELADRRERYVAGTADRDAVGHRRHRRERLGVPGPQRGRVRRGALRLHPDDPDVGVIGA